jgi:hypothetical protein
MNNIVIQSNNIKVGRVYIGFAIATMVSGVVSALYVKLVQMPRFVQYLEWDAQELVPDALFRYQQEGLSLLAAATTTTPGMFSLFKRQHHRRQKAQQIEILYHKVNEAKAKQIEVLCPKYCPKEWNEYQKHVSQKKKKGSSSSSSGGTHPPTRRLQDHPTWLKKLTKALYQTKIPALLRPDYVIGLGRKGIDMTTATRTSQPGRVDEKTTMIDSELLDAVIADLNVSGPAQYPTIWESYQMKLLPGQGLQNRHDLVLKMVKDIQLYKQQQQEQETTTISSSTQPTTGRR